MFKAIIVLMCCREYIKRKVYNRDSTKNRGKNWEYTIYILHMKCNIHFNLHFDKLQKYIVKPR